MKDFFKIRNPLLSEEGGAGEQGTPSLVAKYKNATPGQNGSAPSGQQPARRGDKLNAKFEPVKEDVEELDELSKSTLGSYAKAATRDAVLKRKIASDFEHMSDRARAPGMKHAAGVNAQKYKEKSWKRRDGVDKAVDRLTKEEAVGIDELSNATLKSYSDKGAQDAADNVVKSSKHQGMAMAAKKTGSTALARANTKIADRAQAKANKRIGGLIKAASKMKESQAHFDSLPKSVAEGLMQRKREDDEYHNGPDPVKHTYKYTVSKSGGEKHQRTVTTPPTTAPKHMVEPMARAHLKKQGYTIHESKITVNDVNSMLNVLKEAATSIDKGEYDYEGQMARTQLQTTLRNCKDLISMIGDDDNMPEWVQSKITLAQDYITTVRDYLQSIEELGE